MKRVMIVDYSALSRSAMRFELEENEYRVVAEADSKEKAVSLYRQLRPDIVIMDISLPKFDGVSAVQEIRKFDANAKIITFIAMGQKKVANEMILAGAKQFFVKPLNKEYVLKTLEVV